MQGDQNERVLVVGQYTSDHNNGLIDAISNIVSMENPDVIPGVLLFFKRVENGINYYALHLRKVGFNQGLYCTIGGHNEGVERYEDCAIREGREEVGVEINEKDLFPAHLIYRKGNARGGKEGIGIRPDMCFVIENWSGDFVNKEAHKHSEIEWYSIDTLPVNTVDYVRQALVNIEKAIFYSTHGF